MTEQIRRVAVWSPRLRITHWLMALASIVLMATGWLLDAAPSLAEAASDYHYLAAAVLTFAILLRLWIGVFGQGAERFANLLLSDSDVRGARDSLVFYLSFGKSPLPNWYAHNPLWKPVYLLWFLVLLGSLLTGWLMPGTPVIGGVYLPTLHGWLANATAMLLLLHLYSVMMQDLRGQSADVSAMIGGHRYFSIDRDGLVRPDVPSVSVRLDDIRRDDDRGR